MFLCKSEEIIDNSWKVFGIGGTDIMVGRRSGRLFACNNSCPHRGASLSKGDFNDDNIVCYMHGYEYNVFTAKLVDMKSWKKEDTWMEQNPEWRKSEDLILYSVFEKDGNIYLNLPEA